MPCIAPSEIVTTTSASAFGRVVERTIGEHYKAFVGRSLIFPASLTDFHDFTAGFANVTLFIAWLEANNPSLSPSQLLWLRRMKHGVRVPDMATHDRPAGAYEFYEVKPNSVDGNAAGFAKLAHLAALCAFFDLPYVFGRRWRPDVRIPVWSGVALGHPVRVEFHFFRRSPGLIVYELCLEGELAELTLEVILAILAAIIAAILLRGGLRNLPRVGPVGPPLVA